MRGLGHTTPEIPVRVPEIEAGGLRDSLPRVEQGSGDSSNFSNPTDVREIMEGFKTTLKEGNSKAILEKLKGFESPDFLDRHLQAVKENIVLPLDKVLEKRTGFLHKVKSFFSKDYRESTSKLQGLRTNITEAQSREFSARQRAIGEEYESTRSRQPMATDRSATGEKTLLSPPPLLSPFRSRTPIDATSSAERGQPVPPPKPDRFRYRQPDATEASVVSAAPSVASTSATQAEPLLPSEVTTERVPAPPPPPPPPPPKGQQGLRLEFGGMQLKAAPEGSQVAPANSDGKPTASQLQEGAIKLRKRGETESSNTRGPQLTPEQQMKRDLAASLQSRRKRLVNLTDD